MKFFTIIKTVLLWIWQLPQNFVGACILLVNLKNRKKGHFIVYYDKNNVLHKGFIHNIRTLDLHSDIITVVTKISMYTVKHLCDSGISLGNRIIIDSDLRLSENTVRHEYGHQRQSLYLGWLYLIIIGIPSVCGNIINRTLHKKWSAKKRVRWYYSQPWEKWADSLGEVSKRF